MSPWASSLLSVTGVSLVSLIGILALPLGEGRVKRVTSILVSFAVGALLGDAFIHLLPEALTGAGDALQPSLLVLAGLMLFFAVEKLLRHAHGANPLAAINIIGDGIHNFIDGMLIAASYLVSPVLGASTTLAVVLHEIPQELGDFGILVHAGLTPRRALLLNLASACTALLGCVGTLLVGGAAGEAASRALVPLAAGGFVYIACADLIPELQRERRLGSTAAQIGLISIGVAVMAALKRLG